MPSADCLVGWKLKRQGLEEIKLWREGGSFLILINGRELLGFE